MKHRQSEQKIKLLRVVVATLGICGVLSSNSALAQEAEEVTLEEVVVTAQKREQSIRDIPFGITAFSEEQIGILNVQNFADYARSVPSLDFQDTGATGNRGFRPVAIRGVYGSSNSAFYTDTVSFYINETPIRSIDPGILSLERIEVLRGPQGTLWGANSMGGVIRLITKRADPEGEVNGSFRGDFSTTSHGGTNYAVAADINIPISENLAFAGSISYREDSGYIDNVPVITFPDELTPSFAESVNNANDASLFDFFGELRWMVSDSVEISPSLLYHKGDRIHMGAFNEAVGSLLSNFESPTTSDEKYYIASLPISVDFSSVSLSSITSYSEIDSKDLEDSTEGNLVNFTRTVREDNPGTSFYTTQQNFTEISSFTQEFRLTNIEGGAFDWVLGLFYQDGETNYINDEIGPDWSSVPTIDLWFGSFYLFPAASNEQVVFVTNDTTIKELALFGTGTLHLLDDRLHLTAGLRWFDNEKAQEVYRGVDFFSTAFGIPTGTTSGKQAESDFTYKFSAAYDVNDSTNLYFTTATGYRPGGYNFVDEVSIENCGYKQEFDSDTLTSYEIGSKSRTSNGRLQLSAAAYYIDWQDIQQFFINPIPGCFGGNTQNFGAAEIKGAEIELSAMLTDNFIMGFSGSYTDATFTESNPAIGLEDGDRVPLVSKWNLSTYGQLDFPVGSIQGYVRGDIQYTSDAPMDYQQTNYVGEVQESKKDSFTNVGASFGVQFGEGWDARIYGTNLLDETPAIGARYVGTQQRRVYTLRPRTFGLQLVKHF